MIHFRVLLLSTCTMLLFAFPSKADHTSEQQPDLLIPDAPPLSVPDSSSTSGKLDLVAPEAPPLSIPDSSSIPDETATRVAQVPHSIQEDLLRVEKMHDDIKQRQEDHRKEDQELKSLSLALDSKKKEIENEYKFIVSKINLDQSPEDAASSLKRYLDGLKRSHNTIAKAGGASSPRNAINKQRLDRELSATNDKYNEEKKKLDEINSQKKKEKEKLDNFRKNNLPTDEHETVFKSLIEKAEAQQKIVKDLLREIRAIEDNLKPYQTSQSASISQESSMQKKLEELLEAYENVNNKKAQVKEIEKGIKSQKANLKTFIENCLQGKNTEEIDFYNKSLSFQEAKKLVNFVSPTSSPTSKPNLTNVMNSVGERVKIALSKKTTPTKADSDAEWDD